MIKGKKIFKSVPIFLAIALSLSTLSALAADRVQDWSLGSPSSIEQGKDADHWWWITSSVRFYGNVDKMYPSVLGARLDNCKTDFEFYHLIEWAPDQIVGSLTVPGENVRSTSLRNCNGTYYYFIKPGTGTLSSYGTVYYS